MRFAWLRHYASVNNHFFGDRFSFHFHDLDLGNRSGLFLFLSNDEPLGDPDKPRNNQYDRERPDNDLFLFHLGCNDLFILRYMLDSISSNMWQSSYNS